MERATGIEPATSARREVWPALSFLLFVLFVRGTTVRLPLAGSPAQFCKGSDDNRCRNSNRDAGDTVR